MRDKKINPAFRADGWVLLIFFVLLAFGWISVCGASHSFGELDVFTFDTRVGKQLLWIACSLGLGTIILMFDDHYFDMLADLFYWVMMVVLFVTPFLANDIKGSRSWISLGPVSLQPAEFAKCATALMVAKLINQNGFTLNIRANLLRAAGVVLLPFVLIVMQKETGSALVYLSFFLMFYREGMPGSILFCGFAAIFYFVVGIGYSFEVLPGSTGTIGEFVVLFFTWLFTVGMLKVYCPRQPEHAQRIFLFGLALHVVAYAVSAFIVPFDVSWAQLAGAVLMIAYLGAQWLGQRMRTFLLISIFSVGSIGFLYASEYALENVLKDYQRTRIKVLLGIEEDRDASYNVNQSKIAIGSGGLEGKGFMNGTQTKLDYVPEQDTDFIFCTVGEEWGFVGCLIVILLYVFLIARIILDAEKCREGFSRIYGYCVASIIFMHLFINIGMTIGLMPVIGIPLPLLSYGGSSLWAFTILIFIFVALYRQEKKYF